MVKVLELADTESKRVYRPTYQSELFRWLQRPDSSPAPQLELGHRAVLRAAFGGIRLESIANRIAELDYEEDQTAAQLVVSGIDFTTIDESDITPDLTATLAEIGARPHAHKYARNLGEIGVQYGFSDVFTADNYRANQALAWLERPLGAQPALNQYAENRMTRFTKRRDLRDARLALSTLKTEKVRLPHLLLSGFRAPVLLADYEPAAIKKSSETIKSIIYRRHALAGARATTQLQDYDATARGLAALQPRPHWGNDASCSAEDDLLLESVSGNHPVDPRARLLCGSCAVRLYCLQQFIRDDTIVVRGGLGPSERAKLRHHMGIKDKPTDIEKEPELEAEEEIAS